MDATPAEAQLADELAARFTGVFARETVDRYVFESYTALRRTAKVTTHLPALTARFATERLTAALARWLRRRQRGIAAGKSEVSSIEQKPDLRPGECHQPINLGLSFDHRAHMVVIGKP